MWGREGPRRCSRLLRPASWTAGHGRAGARSGRCRHRRSARPARPPGHLMRVLLGRDARADVQELPDAASPTRYRTTRWRNARLARTPNWMLGWAARTQPVVVNTSRVRDPGVKGLQRAESIRGHSRNPFLRKKSDPELVRV